MLLLKNIVEKIPFKLGKILAYTPYNIRLGSEYTKFCKLILRYENASEDEKINYTITHLNKIIAHSQKTFPFYQKLYGKSVIQIKTLSDFENLPIITKSNVREFSKNCKGAYKLNTGGSTQGPLSFYVDKFAWAREWAHMHYIWNLRDYNYTKKMITMMGRELGNKPFKYNLVHNEFMLNPYIKSSEYIEPLLKLIDKENIQYFQGYPSTIYNFFKEIEDKISSKSKDLISSKLNSLLFTSEFPMPYMIKYLDEVWGLNNYISWYGLSEMCVLAYDNLNNNKYKPFTTYSHVEESDNVLIGTSFHNYDMPLIRYSTEDIIKSKKTDSGLIDYFEITDGRSSDYIEDFNGRKLSLTFLVGRHHPIYDIADFYQIFQSEKGFATIFITFKGDPKIHESEAINYFDKALLKMNVKFTFKFLKTPIRTKRGKLKIRLTNKDIN